MLHLMLLHYSDIQSHHESIDKDLLNFQQLRLLCIFRLNKLLHHHQVQLQEASGSKEASYLQP